MTIPVKHSVKGVRIVVGLSGGVDSAVTAARLKEAGADVIGVFVKGWYPPGLPCTWAEDRRDAMRVAAHLSIPFHTLDASDEYKRYVIDYMVSEYRAGRTPNPDVMCNREVKFGALYRFAMEQGAAYLATGHYARANEGHLYRGTDPGKDQSYFLWAVSKEAITKSLFPLGEMEKEETRALAKRFMLPVADKKDSQGICFLGPVSMDDFLRAEFGTEQGDAVDEAGTYVGRHDGVLLSTIGERIQLAEGAPGPWYVVRKDVPENRIMVAKEHERVEAIGAIQLTETNFLQEVRDDKVYAAQYRYHGPLIQGRVRGKSFEPQEPLHETLADGQSLVIYDGDELIGGGIISSSERDS